MDCIKKMLCEEGKNGEIGKPSLGRVLCFISASMIIVWGSYIAITTGKIPDLPAEWVAFPIGLYGLNKFGGK